MHRALSVLAFGAGFAVVAACSSGGQSAPAAPAKAPAATSAAAPSTPSPAAAQPASASTAAPTPASIKAGIQNTLTAGGMCLAVARGYLAEQGIEASIEEISSPQAMVPAVATGQVDLGNGAMSASLWNALARGADVRLVALQSYIPPGVPGAGYVVRKQDLDSGFIGDFPTLKGKRVSNNGSGNYTQIVLGKAADKGGLTLDDVEIVDMQQPDAVVALQNGSIDVATVSEPIRTAVLNQGLAVQWKEYYEIAPGQQATAWVYSPQFAHDRPEVGRRLMVALLKGIRELYDAFNKDVNRDEVIDILTHYLTIKDPAQYAGLRAQIHPNGEFNTEMLQSDVDWYVAHGFSPQRIDVTTTIDRGFLDYALQQLGRYQQ
ncbi:MAG TPA: ABC transporter substrate-binding protein [Chloroflexota bacterium]|jgi:NitT/TauT family transport system substrate-binding protein